MALLLEHPDVTLWNSRRESFLSANHITSETPLSTGALKPSNTWQEFTKTHELTQCCFTPLPLSHFSTWSRWRGSEAAETSTAVFHGLIKRPVFQRVLWVSSLLFVSFQVGAVNDTEWSTAKRGRRANLDAQAKILRILSELIQWKWGPWLNRMAAGERNWMEDRWNLLCNVAYHFHLTYHQENFPALEEIVHTQLFIQVLLLPILFIHPFIHFLFSVANPFTSF